MIKNIIRQIQNRLNKAENILLVVHQNPDGDTLGSASALIEYLHSQKKKTGIFCASPVPRRFAFLAHSQLVNDDEKQFDGDLFDTIIVLDSGDLKYAGVRADLRGHAATVINIDHHPTNEKYGHINLVVPGASSTTEIIYTYMTVAGIRINRNMATALLTGIITDTDNFSNPATTEMALRTASDLIRKGANTTLIHNNVTKNKTVNILKLWGVVLSRLEKIEEIDLAYTYITKADIAKHNVSEAEAEGISNFLNRMDGPKISLLIKETADGKIKGSFRTTSDDTDVAAIAKKFGGGGHKKAAGFTAEGTIDSVLGRIIEIQTKK